MCYMNHIWNKIRVHHYSVPFVYVEHATHPHGESISGSDENTSSPDLFAYESTTIVNG